MRRLMLVFAVLTLAATLLTPAAPSLASPAVVAAVPVPTVDVTCDAAVNNAPAIEAVLSTSSVVLHGWCGVDWAPLPRNPTYYWKGIVIRNDRVFTIAADGIVFLRPNQTDVPYDRRNNKPSASYGDILTASAQPAENITINGAGVLDGMAANQTGLGYDGIQLQDAINSRITDLNVRNIRGKDALGGDTESTAVHILDSRATAANPIVIDHVHVTTNSAAHRAVSSTGIGAAGGANVTMSYSTATNLKGRCFSAYNADNVRRNNNIGDNCDSAAFGNEEGSGGVDTNNWYANSGVGIAFVNEANFTATGMVIAGNRDYAAVANGCTNIRFQSGDLHPTLTYFGSLLTPGCLVEDNLVRHP